MRRSTSRDASSEFERISLDELPPQGTRPQLQINIVPPTDSNPPVPSSSPSLSPSRPIIIPRVSLQRNISSGPTSHWRKPSYSRVDSSANPKGDSPSSSRQYDEEGGVELEVSEVEEGLNAALGTGVELGSWLPTTRQPSFRRVEPSPAITTPQIVVDDTALQDVFVPDERETAGLAVNAGQIAGTAPVRRARTLSPGRGRPGELLGYDLGTLERRGSAEGDLGSPTSPAASDADKSLAPTTNSVFRHIRKASQRVVNLANAGDGTEQNEGFPFIEPTKSRPTTREGPAEFPFPSLGQSSSSVDKFATEFNVAETGHSPHIDAVALRGKSLGIFGPDNYIRNRLCNLLLHSYINTATLIDIVVPRSLLSCWSL